MRDTASPTKTATAAMAAAPLTAATRQVAPGIAVLARAMAAAQQPLGIVAAAAAAFVAASQETR